MASLSLCVSIQHFVALVRCFISLVVQLDCSIALTSMDDDACGRCHRCSVLVCNRQAHSRNLQLQVDIEWDSQVKRVRIAISRSVVRRVSIALTINDAGRQYGVGLRLLKRRVHNGI